MHSSFAQPPASTATGNLSTLTTPIAEKTPSSSSSAIRAAGTECLGQALKLALPDEINDSANATRLDKRHPRLHDGHRRKRNSIADELLAQANTSESGGVATRVPLLILGSLTFAASFSLSR